MVHTESLSPPQIQKRTGTAYPFWGLVVVTALLYLGPFTTQILNDLAFAICVYRILRYDAKVFAVDYAALIPFAQIFQTQDGFSMLYYLSVLAAFWYLFRNGARTGIALAILLIFLNYLLLRSQWEFGRLLMCISPLLLLLVLLPAQDSENCVLLAKVFCASLLISVLYAFLLRNTPQLQALLGTEVPAFWGSTTMRFQGLFQDPNYFMAVITMAVTLVIRLYCCHQIRPVVFWVSIAALLTTGLATLSKTFLVFFIVVMMLYFLRELVHRDRQTHPGMILLLVLALIVMIQVDDSIASVAWERLTRANDLDELTTGRSHIFTTYLEKILETPVSLLFGAGLGAGPLERDTHNLFLEVIYHTGLTGMGLLVAYSGALIHLLHFCDGLWPKNSPTFRYTTLIAAIIVFCTLHGMFSILPYVMLFLSFICMIIPDRKGEM